MSNEKLFVFDRKEIILIFVFVTVITATAFTLGVRVGKGISLRGDGYTRNDTQDVYLKSEKEENIDDLLKEGETKLTPSELEDLALKKADQNLEKAKEVVETPPSSNIDSDIPARADIFSPKEDEGLKLEVTKANSKDQYSGKYTVQVGSFDNLSDAKEFAETFLVRGYDVVIRQVELGERGTYFRVSLGAYKSFKEAEAFINKERELFMDQDKIIKKFD